MNLENFTKLPPWWCVPRTQLADMLHVSPQYLAQAAQRRQGPPPLPREWVYRPETKVYYRLSDVFSTDAEADARHWLDAYAAPHVELPADLYAAMAVADGAIAKRLLAYPDRRDWKRQPRLRDGYRYELLNNPTIAVYEPLDALEVPA